MRKKKDVLGVEMMELLHCHEQSGIVLPMLSAFTVPILEFLTIYDKKEATTVIESDKIF